jgi:probable HAF family extracellular repeat protein
MLKNTGVITCIIVLLSVPQTMRGADAYALSIIDAPGSSLTVACGIDSVGRITGYYADNSGTHGFLIDNGVFVAIDFPGAGWTAAYGVNTAGQVVGAYGPNGFAGRHGFLRSGGSFTTLDYPGSTDTLARAINNRGQIVGDYLGSDGLRHGFLLTAGKYSPVEPAGSGGGSANGINDSGQIAGSAGSGINSKGFLFSGGEYSAIQVPNSNYAEASGLNNVGDIVGQLDSQQAPRAFRWSRGQFTILELPNIPSSWDARGINDLGQIVGAFTGSDGGMHGYRVTPAALRIGPRDPTAITTSSTPGAPGPAGPAGTRGPAARETTRAPAALNAVEEALRRTSDVLQKSVYQSGYVERAKTDIALLQNDVSAAIAFLDSHGNAPASSFPASVAPNFTASDRDEAPALGVALNNLKRAFESFARAPGGDLGGLRSKINNGMAAGRQ